MGRPEKPKRPLFDHDTMHGLGIIRQALKAPSKTVQSSVKNLPIILIRPLWFLDPPFELFFIALNQGVKLIVLIFFLKLNSPTPTISWS